VGAILDRKNFAPMGLAKFSDPPQRGGSGVATLGEIVLVGPEPPSAEDEWAALVRSIAARDERALHALYHRTYRIVFTLIVRITRDRETAEELTVDVFHEVWRRASEYDDEYGSVVGWVMNLARSRAIDRLRFEGRKKRVNPKPDDPPPNSDETGPHEALEYNEQRRRLCDALTLLSPQERQAIEIAFFSGLTHPEMAERLGEPLGTIKTRIRSGLRKLRQALRSEVRR
jgi:RNA polymerase sigma-70 factor (ECF subfamily)